MLFIRAKVRVYNLHFASRKQRRPPAGQDVYWVRTARVQAGLPHVWEEPGTFVDDSDWDQIDNTHSHIFWKCPKAIWSALTPVLFSAVPPHPCADWHVCRFRHHDRQVAGWDHSAYPAVQSHHRQDKVRRSALITVQHAHYWRLFCVLLIDYWRAKSEQRPWSTYAALASVSRWQQRLSTDMMAQHECLNLLESLFDGNRSAVQTQNG